MARALVSPHFGHSGMLYIAIGIIGATVMPHNLYLHSGLVQTRGYGDSLAEKREAITLATIDSTIALCFAFVINASILILAAATFHRAGRIDVAELDQAHAFLSPLLGSTLAPTLFAIALLCCGLNSTITATLSGQIVMEGFLNWRIAPWMRRMVTRLIAIVPAVIVARPCSSSAIVCPSSVKRSEAMSPRLEARTWARMRWHGTAGKLGGTGGAATGGSVGSGGSSPLLGRLHSAHH